MSSPLILFVFCVQMLLLSQDYGKHLLGVEDLLQKHTLVEADIAIQADRVKAVSANANKYAINENGEQKPPPWLKILHRIPNTKTQNKLYL